MWDSKYPVIRLKHLDANYPSVPHEPYQLHVEQCNAMKLVMLYAYLTLQHTLHSMKEFPQFKDLQNTKMIETQQSQVNLRPQLFPQVDSTLRCTISFSEIPSTIIFLHISHASTNVII